MPGSLTFVSKGRVIQRTDEVLTNPSVENLERMRAGESLTELGIQQGSLANTAPSRQHANEDWYGSSWWSEYPDKETVVRGGYIQAYELALSFNPPKPIVSYWVKGLDTFEVIVSNSHAEVHVFLLTPDHDRPPQYPTPIDEDLWVVGTEARIAEVQAGFPEGWLEEPHEVGGAEGVRSLRVKGY